MIHILPPCSAFSLGNVGPGVTALANGRGAAFKVFEVIERKSPIDPRSSDGNTLPELKGNVDFVGIDFHYPSRPDAPILKNFSLSIKAGQTVALVGMSG